jgi:hypothetical protein
MKNPHAQMLGRLGGLARAKAITRDRMLEILTHARAVKAKRSIARRKLSHDTGPEPGSLQEPGSCSDYS